MEHGETATWGDAFSALGSGIVWFGQNLIMGFYNILYALFHPGLWLDWLTWDNTTEDKQSLMRFIYFGNSVEFFFALIAILIIVTGIGLWRREFMWGCVRVLEAVSNTTGRLFAWAGLLMVLQQIVIVFMQRIFTRPDISFGFGIPLQFDISWYAEELKLYNAMIVCMCVTYTFVQGGHVRVDLIYSAVKFRTKKVIDMVGALLFMMPMAVLVWLYSWSFSWRALIVPPVNATDPLDRLVLKARALRWNIETIGFSPNGFNAYFLFKFLLLSFCALIFLQSIAFFYRSFLEYSEGEASENKYLDRDTLGDGEEAYEGTH